MSTSFDNINSATQYPSIETYHKLGERGRLTEELNFTFEGNVILTEKIDGTNGRAILMPDGDFFIGSRKEILYAKGDRRIDPAQSIVETMLPIAKTLTGDETDGPWITVLFGEVYGAGVGAAGKQYSLQGKVGFRLFDIAYVPMEVLEWPRENIALWRDGGGQKFATEATLLRGARNLGVPVTPRLGTVSADQLPTTVQGMHDWLANSYAAHSLANLDSVDTPGASEGVVLRTQDRRIIAKARLQDYERTLRAQTKGR